MHALIVHAHPEPTSFNAGLRDAAAARLRAEGHGVTVSDLFAEGFNPVPGRHDFTTCADAERFHYQAEQAHAAAHGGFSPELVREQERVRAADLLILQFPLWWGAAPGIMKGWFERVLAYGFAYVDGRRFDTGLLKGRSALVCVTTGGTRERFSDTGVYGEIDKVLWPVTRTTLEYMGLDVAEPYVCYAAPRVDAQARAAMLAGWADRVSEAAARQAARGRVEMDAPLADGGRTWTSAS
ncbi:NAD(P)H-dependent oxidoreductase [uncultured Alsobacter sp.]|uniref:NAD(P)H-dependent oxidoreductase n=1 Tax=uncultured Alsobacter sp. TaxID=1748258 RepID=UPI0025FD6F0E|nr:NAD(P)H-dependent oxidoreductase [uncultured Alsobacter sp.]